MCAQKQMLELKEKVLPLMELVKSGKIVDNEADYVRSKFHILMGWDILPLLLKCFVQVNYFYIYTWLLWCWTPVQ